MSDSTLVRNDWPQLFDRLVARYMGDDSFGPDEAGLIINLVQNAGLHPEHLLFAEDFVSITADAWTEDAKRKLSDFFARSRLLSMGRQVFFGQEVPRALRHSDLPTMNEFLNGAIERGAFMRIVRERLKTVLPLEAAKAAGLTFRQLINISRGLSAPLSYEQVKRLSAALHINDDALVYAWGAERYAPVFEGEAYSERTSELEMAERLLSLAARIQGKVLKVEELLTARDAAKLAEFSIAAGFDTDMVYDLFAEALVKYSSTGSIFNWSPIRTAEWFEAEMVVEGASIRSEKPAPALDTLSLHDMAGLAEFAIFGGFPEDMVHSVLADFYAAFPGALFVFENINSIIPKLLAMKNPDLAANAYRQASLYFQKRDMYGNASMMEIELGNHIQRMVENSPEAEGTTYGDLLRNKVVACFKRAVLFYDIFKERGTSKEVLAPSMHSIDLLKALLLALRHIRESDPKKGSGPSGSTPVPGDAAPVSGTPAAPAGNIGPSAAPVNIGFVSAYGSGARIRMFDMGASVFYPALRVQVPVAPMMLPLTIAAPPMMK